MSFSTQSSLNNLNQQIISGGNLGAKAQPLTKEKMPIRITVVLYNWSEL